MRHAFTTEKLESIPAVIKGLNVFDISFLKKKKLFGHFITQKFLWHFHGPNEPL